MKYLNTKSIVTSATVLATVIAVVLAVPSLDDRWVKAKDLQKTIKALTVQVKGLNVQLEVTNKRLDRKILEDNRANYQKRIWKMEDRYAHKTVPEDVKTNVRFLKDEIRKIDLKLNEVTKRGH